jgi:TonB-dependent starch-binding outer membrane protein SusC
MKKNSRIKTFLGKIMRFTLIQMAFLILGITMANAHESLCQDVLDQKVSITAQSADMRLVLNDIEKQTSVKFVFSNNTVKNAHKVTLNVASEKLSAVLSKILTPLSISYQLVGSRILLKKTETKPAYAAQQETEPLKTAKPSLSVSQLAAVVITGVVMDEKGELLVGASVVLEGTRIGTVTDENGKYKIEIDGKEKKANSVFSFVGYEIQIISIDGQNVINVVLKEGKALTEVVVIGYGEAKRTEITGAISKYRNDRLEETPVSRLDQALQGKIAGVEVQNISSEAGSDVKVRVRGLSSINADASPLVVVDGVPVPEGLSFVNMADVESVEVLKDAASAAIYGSRGAAGVILITTKSGKAEKPKFSVKISNGYKSPYKVYSRMTMQEYGKLLFDEAAIKATDPSITPPTGGNIMTEDDRAAYVIATDLMHGVITDWQRLALRTANTQNIQATVSGGNKDLRYFISAGYQNDQGMMIHSEYERFNLRSKTDINLSKKVKLSINVNPSLGKRERPSTNFVDYVRFPTWLPFYLNEEQAAFVNQNPLYADLRAGDYAQARYWSGKNYSGTMPDGSAWSSAATTNPFNTSNNAPFSVAETRNITSKDFRVLSSADLMINLLPGLDFKSLASANVSYSTGVDFAKTNSNRGGDVNKGVYTNRLNLDYLSENTLTFKKERKGHSISLLAGITGQITKVNNEQTTGLNFPSDNITTLNTALTIDQSNTFNTRNQIGLLSYLGRASYAYRGKYLFSTSFRADGSSYFAPGKKWGYFPSVSAGWVVSEEKFMKKIKWLDQLKLRGSYGATGNNRIVDFAYLDLLYASNYILGAGTGTTAIGLTPSKDILSNPNITWERTFSYNLGTDISMFKNAVTISLDAYQSETEKLLLKQAALNFTGAPLGWNNIGRMQNRGVEFEISTVNLRTKNFKWTTSANISHTENKILELGDEAQLLNYGERTEIYMNKVGGPLVQFFGFKTDGVWLSQQQVTDSKLTSNLGSTILVPGGLKIVDVNGDGKLTSDDRTVIGNPYPDFTWGITNSFNFKGFDFKFLVQGAQGGQLINGDPNYLELKRTNRAYNQNRWLSPANPGDGKTPYSSNGYNWMLTDYVVEDASYFSLREVLLGYTLPKNWTKRANLNGVRIYFSAQNLYFHNNASYRGLNSESRFTSGPYSTPLADGYQRGAFPMNKTFLFGLDFNF